MSEWKARKFWKAAAVEPASGGFRVTLDGKPVMTPGKQPLILPTRALADAVAAEWDAQGDVIDPLSMPLTRAANSAIEKVTPNLMPWPTCWGPMAAPTCSAIAQLNLRG